MSISRLTSADDLSTYSTKHILSRLFCSAFLDTHKPERVRFSNQVDIKWVREKDKYPAEQEGLVELIQDDNLVARRKKQAEQEAERYQKVADKLKQLIAGITPSTELRVFVEPSLKSNHIPSIYFTNDIQTNNHLINQIHQIAKECDITTNFNYELITEEISKYHPHDNLLEVELDVSFSDLELFVDKVNHFISPAHPRAATHNII